MWFRVRFSALWANVCTTIKDLIVECLPVGDIPPAKILTEFGCKYIHLYITTKTYITGLWKSSDALFVKSTMIYWWYSSVPKALKEKKLWMGRETKLFW